MFAGHFATALIAKQQAPKGHIAYFLAASQMPDLLWLTFSFAGLEAGHPTHAMEATLDNLQVHMTYSHDVLPSLGWIVAVALVGRFLFGGWKPALAGGLLVVVHLLTDYVAGFPHHVFGPDSMAVGTGMYGTAPYTAVAIEAVFTVAVLGWALWHDAQRGVHRSLATYAVWAAVFGGGLAFMFATADLSISELTGVAPPPALDGSAPFVLAANYWGMLLAMVWAETRKRRQGGNPGGGVLESERSSEAAVSW